MTSSGGTGAVDGAVAGLVGDTPVVKENLDKLGVLDGDNVLFHGASN